MITETKEEVTGFGCDRIKEFIGSSHILGWVMRENGST